LNKNNAIEFSFHRLACNDLSDENSRNSKDYTHMSL